MLQSVLKGIFFYTASIAFILFFIFPLSSFSQNDTERGALFVLKGTTKFFTGKAVDGVELELKKDGKTVTKITSSKSGKYYIQMETSTINPQNEYFLYITKEGAVPKALSINTYLPVEEFSQNSFVRYDFDLEIVMFETSVKNVSIDKPSGKIHWDSQQHLFAFDQVYAKIIQKEEEKLKEDPDKFLKEQAEKKEKEYEELAKKKAEEEALKLADQKAKEDAENIIRQNLEAVKNEMIRKRKEDSLADLAAQEKPTTEVEKFEAPAFDNVDQNAFDGASAYSINIAKKTLKVSKDKLNKEKAANLSAKYETNNTLTSLLDMVDEQEKKFKKQ